MLRITPIPKPDGTMQLKLAGRINAEQLDLLTCELHRLGATEKVILDLGEIEFLDGAALIFLAQWDGAPLVLQNGSVFIQRLLKEHGLKGGQ